MKYSSSRTLPSPVRLRDLTTRIAHGEVAALFPAAQDLVLLPHHTLTPTGEAYIAWTADSYPAGQEPEVAYCLPRNPNRGRPGARDDELMPAIAVPPGTRVTWRVTERDVTTTGAVHVDVQGIQPLITGDMPAGAGAPRYTVHTRSVTEDGRRALWELLDELRPYVSATLEAENRLIAREFDGLTGTETEGWGAVDNTSAVSIRELEDIEASLLYGVDHETESPVLRMAKRSALTNINNQPLGAWWERNIRSRAEERIRRHIGDPSIGTKVRRLAAEYLAEADAPSVDGLLAAYRERHPGDRAGRDRIVAALTAGRTIDALSYSLAEHDEGDAL